MRAVPDVAVQSKNLDEAATLLSLMTALGARVQRISLSSPSDVEALCGRALPAAERQAVLDALVATEKDGVARTIEHRAAHSVEQEIWLRTAIIREEGERSLWVASLDITASRQNERQWREVESWLMTLSEALPFDFWICDVNGRYVLQNPASVRRMGLVLGLRTDELALPEHERQKLQRAFEVAIAGGSYREEIELGDGSAPRCVVRVVSPARMGEGIQGVIGVDMDVTELKHTEDRLLESLVELSQTQDVLVQKRQLAALGEMAASLAHEVRNPLGAISNVAALFRRLPGGHQELCGILDDETHRLDLLVTALLQFAQPRPPVLRPVSLGEVAKEALTYVLRAEGGADRIVTGFEIDPDVPPTPIDTELLVLALSNLFRNAVQAMPGTGELKVTVRRTEADGELWAQVSISDSGAGVSPELSTRMFDPFVTSRPTGSGLGLSIVRRVVEDHRGRLEVMSEQGRGTTVTLRLPLTGSRA